MASEEDTSNEEHDEEEHDDAEEGEDEGSEESVEERAEDHEDDDEESESESKSESDAGHGHGHGDGDGHGDHGDDQVPPALKGILVDNHEFHYFKIWGVLTVLFGISYVGPYIGEAMAMFWITFVTAFVVAVIKAGLVVREFMHLPQEPKFVGQICATALVFMALFFFWVAPDVLNHEGANWVNQAGRAYTMTTSHHGAGAEAFDVAAAYSESCASCHGEEGRGNGPDGTAIYPRPTNFTSRDYWASADMSRIVQAINEGGAGVIGGSRYMPAYGTKYPPPHDEHGEGHGAAGPSPEILALAEYVRAFRPAPLPAPAPVIAPVPAPTPEPAPVPDTVAVDDVEGEAVDGESIEVAEAPVDTAAAERDHAAAYIRERMFN